MPDIGIIGYIMIVVILYFCCKMYTESDTFNLRCIISDVDGNRYCVRDRMKLEDAADMLAETTTNLKRIVEHCGANHRDRPDVQRMVKGFNPKKIYETLPTSEYTAYSENKGEKIAFCLDTKKGSEGDMIDKNTLMFVAIHELAHVATESIGHTDEFWTNFKFLIEVAKEIGVYQPEDYKKKPREYCGMRITDNPYYDM